MKAFLVEGYNKSDYISDFVSWDSLRYFENLQQAFQYIDELKEKNYECRVRLTDLPNEESIKSDEHWDIFFGV